jgi:hypothetical protein
MKINVLHIVRYLRLAVLLHLLLALAPVMAQNVARTGETSTFTIAPQPGDTYMWTLYNDSTVNFAVEPGTVSQPYAEFTGDTNSSTVNILWKESGVYFFKVNVSDITGCAQNLKIGRVKVISGVTATLEASPVVCAGETISLTVTLTGTPLWEYTYTDGTNSWTRTNILTSPDVITLTPGPVVTTEYWITTVKDKYGTNITPGNKAKQEVNPLPAKTTIYHR